VDEMKVPKSFRPEKSLEKKTQELIEEREKPLETKVDEKINPQYLRKELELGEGINYHEPISFTLAKYFKDNGYDYRGSIQNKKKVYHDRIEIIELIEEPKKYLFGLIKISKKTTLYLASLWFNNQARGASEDSRWVIEVFGRESIHKLEPHLKKFTEHYDVSLDVRLICEQNITSQQYSNMEY